MAVKIGHASKDEKGKYKYGSAGDQSGVEVYIRSWYSRPWSHVIRFKDKKMADKVAYAMERACRNNKIGYDQTQRNTLLTYARKVGFDPGKVTTKCETDCSALVALCCMYAGIPESKLKIGTNSVTTHTIKEKLSATGKVSVYTSSKYRSSSNYLKRGDILLYEGHHVAVCLDNGKYTSVSNAIGSVVKPSRIDTVKEVQTWLNSEYNYKVSVDGEYGKLTKKALVRALQTELNEKYKCGLVVDGVYGEKTKSAISKHVVLKKGSKGDLVKVLQAFLVCNGYKEAYVDGGFGTGTYNSVKAYQKKVGLKLIDGEAGVATFTKLCA